MTNKKFHIVLIISAILSGCSTFDITDKKEAKIAEYDLFRQEVNAEILRANAWINFMPNAGEKFFIAGEVKLLPSINYNFKSLELSRVEVYRKEKLLFEIIPFVQLREETNEFKTILYSLLKGLSIPPDFKGDQKISFRLIFNFGSDRLIYYINNIEVEKVY